MTTKFFTGGVLAAVAAALAFTAVPASAQDRHHDNHSSAQSSHGDRNRENRGNSGGRHDNRGTSSQRTSNWGQQTQARGNDHRSAPAPRATTNGGWAGWGGNRATTTTQRNTTYVDRNRNTTYVNRNRNTTYRDTRRGNTQQWDRDWRNNSRYDWQRYRSANRNVYHLRPYYAPYRGYSYRRLGIGFYLDPLFFGQNYLIGDPGYYRLPAVYGPYRWVRYYDDALLVNVYTGEVADVIYDFFW